jgi:hypothetical protein
VAALTGKEFQKDKVKLTDKVVDFYNKKYGGSVNTVIGDVKLDKEGVKDSMAHGMGSLKAAAFAAVPDVL